MQDLRKIHAWGTNRYGQCGVGHFNCIRVPALVKDLEEYKVDLILVVRVIPVIVERYVANILFGE